MNRYKKLLWSIPLTWGLFFITISFMPRSVPLPELIALGDSSTFETTVLTPKHLFYIGSHAEIEEEYNSHISKLRFRVLDAAGKEVAIERIERFFFTGKAQREGRAEAWTAHCGSVFKLTGDLAYPFKIQVESNIGELSGLFWAKSSGSFLPVVALLLGLFVLSLCVVYFVISRRRQKSVRP